MNKSNHFQVPFEDYAALHNVAASILSLAEPWKIIAMTGDLGAGKTTLVKAFCEHLQIPEIVSSPTFTMINQYRSVSDEVVYHMDMYRIDQPDDAIQLGLEDYFSGEAWCFIEWPDNIPGWIPENVVSLTIKVDPVTHHRTISLTLP